MFKRTMINTLLTISFGLILFMGTPVLAQHTSGHGGGHQAATTVAPPAPGPNPSVTTGAGYKTMLEELTRAFRDQ
ncbi:MAG: hypothetical protein LBT47_00010 [Deltaproteobacteria bacterium]|jgi:hypothetical protein|nr:hypothetical protein [Deltaproteobacteria bacterium]